jgi:endoglucanase
VWLVVAIACALLTTASGLRFPPDWAAPRPAFYVDPDSSARAAATANPGDAAAARIAAVPQARWFTDAMPVDAVTAAVAGYVGGAATAGKIPVLVTYAVPGRDCGGFSSGGFADAGQYAAWIRAVRAGIAGRPAIVVVEPDALTSLDCLPADARAARYAALADAVAQLQSDPTTAVFVDGGHGRWLSPADLAERLRAVGARGFSLNVSNFFTTAEQQEYGERVSALLGGAAYVVDTSRNGQGPAPDGPLNWCNPPGRGLGALPTSDTAAPHDVADLWIKGPGQSDGDCGRGDPRSGVWFAAYAAELVDRAQR